MAVRLTPPEELAVLVVKEGNQRVGFKAVLLEPGQRVGLLNGYSALAGRRLNTHWLCLWELAFWVETPLATKLAYAWRVTH